MSKKNSSSDRVFVHSTLGTIGILVAYNPLTNKFTMEIEEGWLTIKYNPRSFKSVKEAVAHEWIEIGNL